jgi:phytoene dehydrogenase-like protein
MPPADMSPETMDQEMEQRIKAYRELYDERKLETLKQLEEARRRFEARERAYAEKVENYLKQREERLEEIAKHYDEKRQSIASERDYLVDHHQELLQMAIDRKEAMIQRQEEMRNEAEERKARLSTFLSAMEDMTPQERHNYINQHYQEMFERTDELPGAYPGGSQAGPLVRPPYGENPYSRIPPAPQ